MSKKKKVFNMPYIGIDSSDESLHILYGLRGEATAVFRITNSVVQFSADPNDYLEYHRTMLNVMKILGEGSLLQKLDVLSKSTYDGSGRTEYLQRRYDEHFEGREYHTVTTYLAITKLPVKGKDWSPQEYRQLIIKIHQLLDDNGFSPVLLRQPEIDALVARTLTMDFRSGSIVMDNLQPTDTHITIGGRTVKCLSLIDIDRIDLPEKVSPYIERNDREAMRGFPVDTMAFLHHVPEYETVIYNQVLEIPKQVLTLQKLEVKKKRHSGMPDVSNDLCVADIDRLLADVARENQILVNAHFNIIVCAQDTGISKAMNYLENSLFTQGIIPSRNARNQLELFRAALVGNGVELKPYDMYLTTSDAALTFFFKEALPVSEYSPTGFYVRYTDRRGIPLKIDICDGIMNGRISNRSKFCLGASGTGKSYLLNSLIEQYLLYNTDVVIVDTGHSYSGLCSYFGGKYITYTEEKPITMNPFALRESEYNLEKKDFLQTLVMLLWKGAEGTVSSVEADVISDVITAYYRSYFGRKGDGWLDGLSIAGLEAHLRGYGIDTDLLLREAKEKSARKWSKDYYAILQVQANASADEIKKAFRRLVLIHHPDRGNAAGDRDTAMFPDIAQAYEVLSNPNTRNEYDAMLGVGKLYGIAKPTGDGQIGETAASPVIAGLYREILQREAEELDKGARVETLSFNTFYEFALFMIPRIKQKEHIPFNLDEFRFILKKFYTGGEFESLLNEDTDSSLFDERLVVFEIDNIKESKIFPVVTVIIMDLFLQKMRWRQHQRKALVIEEAWKALVSKMMASYLLFVVKTARKFLGELIMVTQELDDLLGNEIVKDSIIANSDTVILLDQTKFRDNFDHIASMLSINEVERRKIFTVNNLDNRENRGRFKEFYMRRGAVGEVYGNEVSIYQYLTYTTEKPEKLAVESYVKLYGSYPDGLDFFVRHMQETGLPLPNFVGLINALKVALTDRAVALLDVYRQRQGRDFLTIFQRDAAGSGMPLYDWVNAQFDVSPA